MDNNDLQFICLLCGHTDQLQKLTVQEGKYKFLKKEN